MNEEQLELANTPIKLQTLLHQFIQLYDRLTVEHSLMTDRELKLLKRLEKLNETLENLDQVIDLLNKFGPKTTKIIEDVSRNAANEHYCQLSEAIKHTIGKKLDDNLGHYCLAFKEATTPFTKMNQNQEKSDRQIFFMILAIVALSFLLLGIVIGRYR